MLIVGLVASVVLLTVTVAFPQTSRIQTPTADPAYIVVNTPNSVTFTVTIADSSVRRHDPKTVLLVRTDAAGNPVAIAGRMTDTGRKADATASDHIYTIRADLNESAVGTIPFKVAANFRTMSVQTRDRSSIDWDNELRRANDTTAPAAKAEQLSSLVRHLDGFSLSTAVWITVDPLRLPPDPGEAGKQSVAGIDSDHDGLRDDFQRYLGYTYGLVSSPEHKAAEQYGRSMHNLISQQDQQVATSDDWGPVIAASRCLNALGSSFADAEEKRFILEAKMLNTRERQRSFVAAGKAFPRSLDVSGNKEHLPACAP